MHFTPFEATNLIFIDTEFTSLDPREGEILSIGIAKLSGEELYLEIESEAIPSKWVHTHILPTLAAPKVTKAEAVKQVRKFLGRKKPFALAYVDNYDALYCVKLFGSNDALPFKWMTIDFASILFANGINPTKFQASESGAKTFYLSLGIDLSKYRQHHALDDARLLRDVWLALTNAR
jgi:DNA polymerase III epsilon subunit-like protein